MTVARAGATPRLDLTTLNAAAFEPYGEVLENKSAQRRRDFAAPLAGIEAGATTRLWVNRLEPHREESILIDVMECHPRSPQTFVPMRETPYMMAVALAGDDGLPDLGTLRAFISLGGQGICYRPSVWHFAFTSLGEVNEVAVIMADSGRGDDTIITQLAQPVRVDLPVGKTQ